MAYEIYLGNYAGTKVLQLPVPPKEMPSLSSDPSNEVFETYWDLPYNFIEKKGLIEFTLESWLPVDYTKYNFMKSKVNASDIITLIEDAKTNTEPLKIVINAKSGYYVNDYFSVEKFEYKILQRGDYSYTLGVKQWRNPNPIVATSTSGNIGWQSDSTGWWYVYDNSGSYYKNCWQCLDNEWYYFGSDGYALRDSWFQDGGSWYYFSDSCKMYSSSWLNNNGENYYLGADGAMYYGGTYTIDGQDYSFNDDGTYISQ